MFDILEKIVQYIKASMIEPFLKNTKRPGGTLEIG